MFSCFCKAGRSRMKAHDDDDAAGCSSGDAGRAATEAVMNLIGE